MDQGVIGHLVNIPLIATTRRSARHLDSEPNKTLGFVFFVMWFMLESRRHGKCTRLDKVSARAYQRQISNGLIEDILLYILSVN